MTTTIYTSKELSNERYHSEEFPQASGSELAEIYATCPAEFIGRERKASTALEEGSAAHACILEPAQFKLRYARGIDPADYPDALDGNKALIGWLTEAGIKTKSSQVKADFLAMIDATGEKPPILQRIIEAHNVACAAANMEIVDHEAYDRFIKMRSALKKFGYTFSPALQYEVSIIGNGLKTRIDIIVPPGEMAPDGRITTNGEIWEYKSCADAHPIKFSRDVLKFWYWLKAAVQFDQFKAHFGVEPDRYVILYQKKTAPFTADHKYLTEQQLQKGREQYKEAFNVLIECRATDKWPAEWTEHRFDIERGGPMPTPGWAAFEYGFEDTIEIVEG